MRRSVRRYSRRAPTKRKVVWARYRFAQTNQAGGTVSVTSPLADFETAYGAQLLGATIVGIRGILRARNRSTSTAVQEFTYGFMVTSPEAADLVSAHPDSSFSSANNDRMASWMWIEGFHTFPAMTAVLDSQTDTAAVVQREFNVKSRRVLRQLEDQLVFSATLGTTTSGNYDWGVHMSIAVALP